MIKELARVFAQIALLRRGPQDLPASWLLLGITIVAYVVVNLLVSRVLLALSGPWIPILALDVVFTLTWYVLLLRLVRKPERVLQTTTAVFGYRTVLAPLSIAASWLFRRFGEDAAWQLPLGIVYVVILVWMIAVNSYVLKAALEWTMLQCVGLVLLEIVAGELTVIALVPLPR